MFARKAKSSTDPRLRSLLQKATRRGYPQVVERAMRALDRNGDGAWLRARSIVITFEECWPLGASLEVTKALDSKIRTLLNVARSLKYKDAASLGALAYAYSTGDMATLNATNDSLPIKLVAESLKRPSSFFDWCEKSSSSDAQTAIIKSARRYLGAAGWQWDKACILAAAYLATTADPPKPAQAQAVENEFPYWVALDKHTPQGKEALRKLAKELRKPYRHLLWASFYFESAVVNELGTSPWWDVEIQWRLQRAGIGVDEAETMWKTARDHFRLLLQEDAEDLKTMIEIEAKDEPVRPQGELQL